MSWVSPDQSRQKAADIGKLGAGGENRTRDIQLGKLTFYL
jgi:hypothetical protein